MKDVFPDIEDVLAKHCRGRVFEPTTRENIAAIIDRILTLDREHVQELQQLKSASAAPDAGAPQERAEHEYRCVGCQCPIGSPGLCGECSCEDDGAIW